MYIYHVNEGTLANDSPLSGLEATTVLARIARLVLVCSAININFLWSGLRLPRLAGGQKGSTYAALHLPSILEHYELWRIPLSQMSFGSLGELATGYILFQHLTRFESIVGYKALLMMVGYLLTTGTLLQLLFLYWVKDRLRLLTSLAPGPFALIWGLLILYELALRSSVCRTRWVQSLLPRAGLMLWIVAIMNLVSGGLSAVISAVTGVVAALLWPLFTSRMRTLAKVLERLLPYYNSFMALFGPQYYLPMGVTVVAPGKACDFIIAAELAAAIVAVLPPQGLGSQHSGRLRPRGDNGSNGTDRAGPLTEAALATPPPASESASAPSESAVNVDVVFQDDFHIEDYMQGRGDPFARKLLAMAELMVARYEQSGGQRTPHQSEPNVFERDDFESETKILAQTQLAREALAASNGMVLAAIHYMRCNPSYQPL